MHLVMNRYDASELAERILVDMGAKCVSEKSVQLPNLDVSRFAPQVLEALTLAQHNAESVGRRWIRSSDIVVALSEMRREREPLIPVLGSADRVRTVATTLESSQEATLMLYEIMLGLAGRAETNSEPLVGLSMVVVALLADHGSSALQLAEALGMSPAAILDAVGSPPDPR
jgi:histone H3/H4